MSVSSQASQRALRRRARGRGRRGTKGGGGWGGTQAKLHFTSFYGRFSHATWPILNVTGQIWACAADIHVWYVIPLSEGSIIQTYMRACIFLSVNLLWIHVQGACIDDSLKTWKVMLSGWSQKNTQPVSARLLAVGTTSVS